MSNSNGSKAIVGIIITLLITLLGASVKNAIDVATLKSEWRHTQSNVEAIEQNLGVKPLTHEP
jgi:hypothetical protein